MKHYDAIIVGGGPAGSTCARNLTAKGLKVAVLDAAKFPRDKLCTGWISPPIWDVLGISPQQYPLNLWEWNRVHIHYSNHSYTFNNQGYFIRRFELDNYLLQKSGADVHEGRIVRKIDRHQGSWIIDETYQAKYLVGAGGSACPVARSLFPKKSDTPVTAQEREFPVNSKSLEETRLGKDGEAELFLHDDLKGYSWNVPKREWLNIGSGTVLPRQVHQCWDQARSLFEKKGHVPEDSLEELRQMRGHFYYLFSNERFQQAQKDGAFLVGDALGLAQPITGEGILPAVLSGKLCAEAILSKSPQRYPELLAEHPIIRDYKLYYFLRELTFRVLNQSGARSLMKSVHWVDPIIARVFVALFSGAPFSALELIRNLIPSFGLVVRQFLRSPLSVEATTDERKEAIAKKNGDLSKHFSSPLSKIKVHQWGFLKRMAREPFKSHVHLLDAYVEGDLKIDTPLYPLFKNLFRTTQQFHLTPLLYRLTNVYSKHPSRSSNHEQDVQHHYDLETPLAEGKVDALSFYKLWLGKTMAYTMAYWPRGTRTLDDAQRKKLTLYQKLSDIQRGHDVYEPGFGFGSFIPYVLEKKARWYGANLSRQQSAFVRRKHPKLEIREQDFLTPWREGNHLKKFDRIVSIGNLEHVQNLDECFAAFRGMLKPEGKLFVHLITLNSDIPAMADAWFGERIFPNGQFHNHQSLIKNASPYFDVAYERIFTGEHYSKTVQEWSKLFEKNLKKIKALGAPDRLIRLWRIYLASGQALFSEGLNQNSAYVFIPKKEKSVSPSLRKAS